MVQLRELGICSSCQHLVRPRLTAKELTEARTLAELPEAARVQR
jgi:hypothetical protein